MIWLGTEYNLIVFDMFTGFIQTTTEILAQKWQPALKQKLNLNTQIVWSTQNPLTYSSMLIIQLIGKLSEKQSCKLFNGNGN